MRKWNPPSSPHSEQARGSERANPLVHTQETSVPPPNAWSYRSFLTSGMQKDIDFNASVYAAIDERDGSHRTQVYNTCRTSAWFVRNKISREIRIASSRCSQRWCPLCIKTKRYIIIQSVKPFLKQSKKPKFITLTLKHSDSPLSHQIDSLYGFFRKLRKRPYWKHRIDGGVWFFQITKSKTDGLFHPHLHILCDGKYVPQVELSAIWSEITHGSYIVDIRKVRDPKKAADYVARYASAPCRLLSMGLESAIEVVDAMHGRRICGTFGTGKMIQLAPKKCPDSDDWEFMAGVGEVLYKRNSSDWHSMVWRSYIADEPCYACPDQPPDGWESVWDCPGSEPVKYKQLVFEWNGNL